jgi:hypothetical protein
MKHIYRESCGINMHDGKKGIGACAAGKADAENRLQQF